MFFYNPCTHQKINIFHLVGNFENFKMKISEESKYSREEVGRNEEIDCPNSKIK